VKDKFYEKKVLVVDDEENNIQLIGSILKKYKKKLKIVVASDGKEAIDRCYAFNPDIILMDINMPVMGGVESCKKIKENSLFKDIPVIFLTAANTIEDKLKALKANGNDYIVKPVHEEELILRINVHLSLKISQENLKAKLVQINNMIDNMEQSFFWVSENGLILGPTSKKSERVFGQEIENKNIFETLFKDLEKEKKDNIIEAYQSFKTIKKENWDFFISKIPTRVDYFNDNDQKNKNLNINCHPVWNESGCLEKIIHSIDDRTEYELLTNKKNIYSIKIASQLTGVQENTIRSWERRHNALRPFRNEKGKRIYSDDDIRRINLLKKGIERGISIGSLASLEDEELKKIESRGETEIELEKSLDVIKKLDEKESLTKIKIALTSRNEKILIHELHKINKGPLIMGVSLSFFSGLFEYMKEMILSNTLEEKQIISMTPYFRRFFNPLIYGQNSKKLEDLFILCSGPNKFWELESIQYELLLAEKDLVSFNAGIVEDANEIAKIIDNFESRNIVYICGSQLVDEKRNNENFINKLIEKLRPKQKLILVGMIDFSSLNIRKNNQVEVSLNVHGLERQLINIVKFLS
tara:strand:- start:2500 stop:4251 length:1752 start_codon:yes stop_codon:yes gene_type:complete